MRAEAYDAGGNVADVLVIGAGFAGLFALYRLRALGFSVLVVEQADGIGGTWYFNRYPGSRCDLESFQYSYSFSEEIQREWNWSEVYASQSEILSYLNFVADRLDLRKDIRFGQRVVRATFDETADRWSVLSSGDVEYTARFVLFATGCLSVPLDPAFPGLDQFRGRCLRTSDWPQEEVDFTGQRVGLIGTGSSGIQAAPVIARQAKDLYVFQRTPNYSIPTRNGAVDPGYAAEWKFNYPARRAAARRMRNNTLSGQLSTSGLLATPAERESEFERRWAAGGGVAFTQVYPDMLTDPGINLQASNFVRRKIREIVHDPVVAERLIPADYGIGGKRICADTDYFQIFNRSNVTLIDVREEPIRSIIEDGVRTADRDINLDILVLAVGFDAMTGALARIDISGRRGRQLADHWLNGPRTYLGMAMSGFPNMFLVTGPGSPSVLTNMVVSIEQYVDWIADCLCSLRDKRARRIEADPEAEKAWTDHVNLTAANSMLLKANAWAIGANVPQKPRAMMPYTGGAVAFYEACSSVAREGYRGFSIGSSVESGDRASTANG